ncbi:hypothetical protein L3D22_07845 [Lysobacter soli]|uniref:hypothetical protein n=1 Tax=Lysobacter soli TaxID=453783 RepID=UPI00209CD998|nr:hypothetical protein [Lysobacter soli]UTA55697.1 hypothetical protein L3D22_07845 [Lysobacter soli]
MIQLKERDFEAFFEAPFSAYGPDCTYVSPMKSDLRRFLAAGVNPLFPDETTFTWFTAHRDGHVLGRITAHVHPASNALYGLERAYFGYFDCADDSEAARALLGAAEDWARERGFAEIAGNFNLTAMQQIGVQTGGFEHAPYTDLACNPPHIPRLLEENGYTPFFPMSTFENRIGSIDIDSLIGPPQRAILDSPEFSFAPVTWRTIDQRMEDARVVLNDAFANNPMFVPVTAHEFHFQAKEMKWIMDPRISAVLHHRGEPAACIICIPDLNPLLRATRSRFQLSTPWHFLRHRLRRDRAVLIFSGVVGRLQGKGVNAVVLHRILGAMQRAGYRTLGGTWISDANRASLAQKVKMGAYPLHRLHLFRKDLRA